MKVKFDIKTLSRDLFEIRRERDKGLRVAAKEMDVPHATIYRIENGEHLDIHVGTLVKICNWLKIKPDIYFKKV